MMLAGICPMVATEIPVLQTMPVTTTLAPSVSGTCLMKRRNNHNNPMVPTVTLRAAVLMVCVGAASQYPVSLSNAVSAGGV